MGLLLKIMYFWDSFRLFDKFFRRFNDYWTFIC